MAIAPLQLPGPACVPQLDWSGLDKNRRCLCGRAQAPGVAAALGGLAEELTKRGEPTTPAALEKALQPQGPGASPAAGRAAIDRPYDIARTSLHVALGPSPMRLRR